MPGLSALWDELSAVAGRALEPDLGPGETLRRAGLVESHLRALNALGLADPYAGGARSVVVDTLSASSGDQAAADRLHRADLVRALRGAWAAPPHQTTVETPGLIGSQLVPPGPGGLPGAPFLDAFAVPSLYGYGGLQVPTGWTGGLSAVINSTEKTQFMPGQSAANIDAEKIPWTTAAYAENIALQVTDWAPSAQAELDRVFAAVVGAGLEKALLAQLATAAGTPADGSTDLGDALDDAETSIAGGDPPSHLVVNPLDWPKVRKAYAAAGLWPMPLAVIRSPGQPPGLVLVLASGALYVAATPVDYLRALEPSILGRAVAAFRYGAIATRQPTPAAAAVTLTTTP